MPDDLSRAERAAAPPAPAPCGLGRRLLVMLYDGIVVIVLMMAVTALMLLTPLRNQTAFVDPIPTSILLTIWFLYLGWCWKNGGLTLGMRAWRVRLAFEGGQPPGWGRCLIRFSVSLLSAAALGLGFIWSLFERERRTWHDLASGTALVRTPPI